MMKAKIVWVQEKYDDGSPVYQYDMVVHLEEPDDCREDGMFVKYVLIPVEE
jgi:hypothetical protein